MEIGEYIENLEAKVERQREQLAGLRAKNKHCLLREARKYRQTIEDLKHNVTISGVGLTYDQVIELALAVDFHVDFVRARMSDDPENEVYQDELRDIESIHKLIKRVTKRLDI